LRVGAKWSGYNAPNAMLKLTTIFELRRDIYPYCRVTKCLHSSHASQGTAAIPSDSREVLVGRPISRCGCGRWLPVEVVCGGDDSPDLTSIRIEADTVHWGGKQRSRVLGCLGSSRIAGLDRVGDILICCLGQLIMRSWTISLTKGGSFFS
jgi:hypothetical protein